MTEGGRGLLKKNQEYGAIKTDASGNLKPFSKGSKKVGARKNSRGETGVVTNIKLSRGFHERKNLSGERADKQGRSTSALSNSKSASTVNRPTMDHSQLKDGKGANRANRNLNQHTTETKGMEKASKNKKARPQTSNQDDLEVSNFRVRRVKINKNASSSVKVSIGGVGQNTFSPKK